MDWWSLQRLAARLDGTQDLARLLDTVARRDWEGWPDPWREAVRDLDTMALASLSLRLSVLIVNYPQSAPDLERLRQQVSEELQTRPL